MSEIIQHLDHLNPLKPGWDKLALKMGNPLLSYDWFECCIKSFYPENDLYIATVSDPASNNVSAIAPLVRVKSNGVQRLELIGVSKLHEPSGLLYDSPEALAKLLKTISQTRYPVILQRIDTDAFFEELLRSKAKFRGVVLRRNVNGSPFVSIDSSWENYFSTISSRRRYDLRRAQKRLRADGEVSTQILRPKSSEMKAVLDKAFYIESMSWKGHHKSDIRSNPAMQKFITTLANAFGRCGNFIVCFLNVGGESVAMQLGVEYANRYWTLKIGYNERWSKCSPGNQLTMETLKYCFNHGFEGYEFLGSDEPWLRQWSREVHNYDVVLYYPFSAPGIQMLYRDLKRTISNNLLKKLKKQ
jgi:CelD/BcsL family acetyltransferase involved in cellulose biosynthesis